MALCESGHCILFSIFCPHSPASKYFRRISLSLAEGARQPRSNRSIAITRARVSSFWWKTIEIIHSFPSSLVPITPRSCHTALFTTRSLTKKTRGTQSILSVILRSLVLSVAAARTYSQRSLRAPVDSRHKNTSTQARPCAASRSGGSLGSFGLAGWWPHKKLEGIIYLGGCCPTDRPTDRSCCREKLSSGWFSSENNRPQPAVSAMCAVGSDGDGDKKGHEKCVYRKRKRNGKSDDRNRLTLPDTSISGHCYSSTLGQQHNTNLAFCLALLAGLPGWGVWPQQTTCSCCNGAALP